jgi:hypothetical protein
MGVRAELPLLMLRVAHSRRVPPDSTFEELDSRLRGNDGENFRSQTARHLVLHVVWAVRIIGVFASGNAPAIVD